MNKLVLVVALCLFTGGICAQTSITSPDSGKDTTHDRPAGHVVVKVPDASGGTGGPGEPTSPVDPTPPSDGEDIPPSEPGDTDPPEEDDRPPYYGEPVRGKVVFLLDASGSMYGSRVASMRAETTTVIQKLNEHDEIDAVAYGSQFPAAQHYSVFMWGALLPCTDGNKSSAIAWVNGPATNPGGGTPTYACLKRSCEVYPANLDQMFLITDGYPNVSGSASQILADFPSWWGKFTKARFFAVCIGGGGASFMQQLATLAGGTYIAA
ncbi:MAG: VWA domain-containing protein [Planctomycetes bacterium]|nr:VWA domain-containing protein [Planctomycetota bacterium]MCW8137162.1 VWA domain-containing protein [Planctomycetota bacterium]